MDKSALPTVSVAIPVFNGADQLGRCLTAIGTQTYADIIEILVVDGGSTDDSRTVAANFPRVRILDNPRQSRPAAMNIALREARGAIIIRIDARTLIASDYVARCVCALGTSGATIVGGPMRLTAETARERGIRAAMQSRLGGGPAAFRRDAGGGRYVDTVYLGAFYRAAVMSIGGYDETFGGNEDAELAFRARQADGVYLDPAIRSSYAVRDGFTALWSQYLRYGRARAGTMRKHPSSISPRQLAVPAFLLGTISPLRRSVLATYASVVAVRSAFQARRDVGSALPMAIAFPTMHLAWGIGFAMGMGHRRKAT